MTDLEKTKLCAKAMGIEVNWSEPWQKFIMRNRVAYDPLAEDRQAMALVKRFPYQCLQAMHNAIERNPGGYDLNRACVEAIAKMQVAKVPA